MSEEDKKNLSEIATGGTWHWDADAPGRKILSELKEGVPLGPEHCEAISRGHEGLTRAPFTEEHCRNISLARKKNWEDPKYAELVSRRSSEGLRQFYASMTVEERKSRQSHPGPMSEEGRRNVAEANKRKWKDPEYVQTMVEAFHRRPTEPELCLNVLLARHFTGRLVYNGDGRNQTLLVELGYKGTRQPDFFGVDGLKGVIEVFSWWHDPDIFPKRLTEEEMVAEYLSYGWKCLIMWDDEVYSEDFVVRKVSEFLGER